MIRALRGWPRPITVLIMASATACTTNPACKTRMAEDNGIYVSHPKIYNDKSLQTLLTSLNSRLAQVSGIDQSSLIAHLGTTQGASLAQTQFSLQATALPIPGVTTTTSSGTPSIAQTAANTGTTYTPATTLTNSSTANNSTPSVVQTTGQTSGSGGTVTNNTSTVTTTVSNTSGTTTQSITTTPSNVNGTNNQTVTTSPSNTTQTVTTAPTVTPSAAPLPSTTAITLPSAYNISSLDLLNEQMQLSYEIINLQLLLQGSVDDDYTKSGAGKRHVTLGFPVSITTPHGHEGDVAEVEVSVCNVRDSEDHDTPSLRTIIPREKTYNVASIVSKSGQIGVGAVISNIINIGASFFSGRQTYYLVRDQDTVALQRGVSRSAVVCPGKDPAPPVTFAWQFRPVLKEKSVQQGLRQTFAQISVDPIINNDPGLLYVTTQTCWKEYDREKGVVGKAKICDPAVSTVIQSFYNTVAIDGVTQTDNGDGTITAKVTGAFPRGTGVGLGDASVNDASVGFENTGTFIRFSAPSQLVATRGARLVTPNGLESEVTATGFLSEPKTGKKSDVIVHGNFDDIVRVYIQGGNDLNYEPNVSGITLHLPESETSMPEKKVIFVRRDGTECKLPNGAPPAHLFATTKPYSDLLVEVTVPIWQCMEVQPNGNYPPIVILGGKAIGLSDAPFKTTSPTKLTFLAPPSMVQGQTKLKLKRLFLDSSYETVYDLEPMSGLSVDGISILEVSPKGATFAVTGSQLAVSKLQYPTPFSVDSPSPAFMKFTLTQDQLSSVKQIVLASAGEAPQLYPLPTVSKANNDSTVKISILDISPKNGTTYAITGVGLKDAEVVFPTLTAKPETSDAYMKFLLTVAQLKTVKEVVIQPAKANSDPLVIPLPSDKANDTAKTTVTLIKDEVGVAKGSVAPYTIKGTNLQHVVQLRFENAPVLFSYGAGGTSIIIQQLPSQLVAQSGSFSIEARIDDGTKQYFTLVVK